MDKVENQHACCHLMHKARHLHEGHWKDWGTVTHLLMVTVFVVWVCTSLLLSQFLWRVSVKATSWRWLFQALCDVDVFVEQGKIIVVTFNLKNCWRSQQTLTLLYMLYTDTYVKDFFSNWIQLLRFCLNCCFCGISYHQLLFSNIPWLFFQWSLKIFFCFNYKQHTLAWNS